MNCKAAKKSILDCLASRDARLPVDLSRHLAGCASCRTFQEEHIALFGAVEQELDRTVNVPLPAGFYGRLLRNSAAQAAATRRPPRWGFALVAATLLVVLKLGFPGLRHEPPVRQAAVASAEPIATTPAPDELADWPVRRVGVTHRQRRIAATERNANHPEEVLVLAEEQEAYRRYLSRQYEPGGQIGMLLAPSRPVEPPEVEIRPVEIAALELLPLDGSRE